MSFSPNGMIAPFVRNNQSGNNNKRPVDLLVTVTAYDLGRGAIICTNDKGDVIEATINKETIARNEERKRTRSDLPRDIKWEGHLIDSRMASHIEIGSRIVLERCHETKYFKKNDKVHRIYDANRVLNVSDPSPEKTFTGLFTIYAHEGRIMSVQHWNEKAVRADDAEGLESLRKKMDEAAQAFANKEFRPTIGAQFRFINPTGNEATPYEVLDVSPPFDWIPRKKDENGNVIAEGHPMTGEKLDELLEQYCISYIDQAFPADQYPAGIIEVVPYTNYRASTQNKSMTIGAQTFDPLYIMAHAQTRLALNDPDMVQGKNYAVKGIIQLSADEADAKTKQFKPRNLANRIHANGVKGHVHAWVRTSDDQKCVPHAALKAVLPNQQNKKDAAPEAGEQHDPQPQQQQPQPSAPAQESMGAQQQEPAPAQESANPAGEDPFNGFADPFATVGGEDPFADSAPAASAAQNSPAANSAREHLNSARASFTRKGA